VLADGRVLDVANVIWCTEFQPGLSWIDLAKPAYGADGEPARQISPAPAPTRRTLSPIAEKSTLHGRFLQERASAAPAQARMARPLLLCNIGVIVQILHEVQPDPEAQ
jgi:hypothetical protein